jgi:hypothetical protein
MPLSTKKKFTADDVAGSAQNYRAVFIGVLFDKSLQRLCAGEIPDAFTQRFPQIERTPADNLPFSGGVGFV